jgi:hypothetical protein
LSVRALPFVLVAFLLAGCAFGGESAPEVSGDNGLTRYEISAGRFAIGVPQTWHATSAAQLNKTAIRRFAEQNPALAPYASAVGKKKSPFKFFAYDPVVHNRFSTNVNVFVRGVPTGTTWDAYKRSAIREAKAVADSRVSTEEVQLPAGKALRAEYRIRFVLNGHKRTVSTTQYGLLLQNTSYVLTYTTLPSVRNEYVDWFKLSAESFRPTGR